MRRDRKMSPLFNSHTLDDIENETKYESTQLLLLLFFWFLTEKVRCPYIPLADEVVYNVARIQLA